MLFQLRQLVAKMIERTDVAPIDRMFVVTRRRHILDGLVQVFEQGQGPNVCGGISVFDSVSVCHSFGPLVVVKERTGGAGGATGVSVRV